MTGNVIDTTGASVANAKIEAVHVATGIVKQMMSDERGNYLFSDLQPGAYKVTILVSDSVVTLQTDRADVNNVIRSSQILDLPLINSQGRNFQVLYKALRGFTPSVEAYSYSGNPKRSMGTQANGMPQSSNNTKLDGATISNPRLPNVQNQFGAMYGGRIIRNKLFFFGDWGGTTRRLAAAALRVGLLRRRCAPGIPDVVGPSLTQDTFSPPAALGATSYPKQSLVAISSRITSPCSAMPVRGSTSNSAMCASRAIRTTAIQNINAAGPGGGNPERALNAQYSRISDIKWFTPFNTAQYNGSLTQVTRRFGSSMLGVSYTLSRVTGYVDDTNGGLMWSWVPCCSGIRPSPGSTERTTFSSMGTTRFRWAAGTGSRAAAYWRRWRAVGDELDHEPDDRHAVYGGHIRHVGERAG